GNGNLYGEPRNAIEITCADCHGTTTERATLTKTTGPAAKEGGGTDLTQLVTPFKLAQFQIQRSGRIIQRSMLKEDLVWDIPQVVDSITPGDPHYNEKAAL